MGQRILINRSVGSFCLSEAAMTWLIQRGHPVAIEYMAFVERMRKEYPEEGEPYFPQIDRNDPLLLACFEALGDQFSVETGREYKIVEVPDGVEWEIESNDPGYEWVAEKHRTWS